jgi:cysteine desulfurase
VKNSFIDGYKLEAQINGHQQGDLRGGTENVAGIASAVASCKWNFSQRESKNRTLEGLRAYIIGELSKAYHTISYAEYIDNKRQNPVAATNQVSNSTTSAASYDIVIFGPGEVSARLPNTILLAVVDRSGAFCNVIFKQHLDKKGIVVSIGSACNTAQKGSSHVISALGCDAVMKRGIIRISLGDYNTKAEIEKFVEIFIAELEKIRRANSRATQSKMKSNDVSASLDIEK